MKTTIDYSNRETKQFDAVEDIREWLGKKYDEIAAMMKNVKNPRQFSFWCAFAGFDGYPVEVWYDHFHGQGAYSKAWDELETIGNLTEL